MDFVSSIALDNNQMGDSQFAKLLDALSALADFKSVTYSRNTFDLLSAKAMAKLLDKRVPCQLDELVISNCRTSSKAVDAVLLHLCTKSSLSKLTLSHDVPFSEKTMPLLCRFL